MTITLGVTLAVATLVYLYGIVILRRSFHPRSGVPIRILLWFLIIPWPLIIPGNMLFIQLVNEYTQRALDETPGPI